MLLNIYLLTYLFTYLLKSATLNNLYL